MSSKFRDLLEKQIGEEILEHGTRLAESQNDSIHWIGSERGYLMALRDVLEWSNKIERELNGL